MRIESLNGCVRRDTVLRAKLAIAIVCCMVLAVHLLSQDSTEHSALPTSGRGIPANAAKVTPADDVYPPKLHVRGWAAPVPVPGGVNTAGAEDSPVVSDDGKTLWYFFTPNVKVPPEKQILDGVTGVWEARGTQQMWGRAKRVLLVEHGRYALDGPVCVQGDTMWFCSARVGNIRGVDMWTAKRHGSEWTDWQNAGERLNKEMQIGEVHAMPGGKDIYFHSDRKGGKGGLDIWVTRKVNGRWQDPVNVEAVNSRQDDGWPFVTRDGKELWITRTYQGSPAIFRSRRTGTGWCTPELILSPFAGKPGLDRYGNLYFAHHFFRDGKMIEADIYVSRKVATAHGP